MVTANQYTNTSSLLLLPCKLLLVSPNEWRTDLLTRTERETGESAKAASRQMAQSIIQEHLFMDFNNNNNNNDNGNNIDTNSMVVDDSDDDEIAAAASSSSFPITSTFPYLDRNISNDVAESILLGYHITRRLGWC
jgi:hypothetical protein